MTTGSVTSTDGTRDRLPAGRPRPGRGGAARQQRVGPQPHPARAGAGQRVHRLPARPARPRHVRPAPPGPQHAHRDRRPAGRGGPLRRAEGVRGQRQRADRPAGRPHRPGHRPGRRLRACPADGHLRPVHQLGAPFRPGDGPRPDSRRADHQHPRARPGPAGLPDPAAAAAGSRHQRGHEERGRPGRPRHRHHAHSSPRPCATSRCCSPRWPEPSPPSPMCPPMSC